MNKSTKGAIAAAASAVLLLGGAGTLAYWNADGSIAGGDIEAGTLTMTETTAGAWTLNGTPVASNNLSSVLVVPGDTLTYTGAWTIGATGDNLQADVTFTGLDATPSVADKMTVTPAYTLAGTSLVVGAGPEITEANDADVLGATVVVDFPFGSAVDNTSQGMTLDLTDGGVTLTQVDATP